MFIIQFQFQETFQTPAEARQLSQANIEHSDWEQLAENRAEWKDFITETAAENVEENRKSAAEYKRQRRKQSASEPQTDLVFTCPHCSWACRSTVSGSAVTSGDAVTTGPDLATDPWTRRKRHSFTQLIRWE